MNSHFTMNWIAFALFLIWGLIILAILFWRKKQIVPILFFSDLEGFASEQNTGRAKLTSLPNKMKWASLILFAIAFTDPHYLTPRLKEPAPPSSAGEESNLSQEEVEVPVEGIAIYFVLDQSGSMREAAAFQNDLGKKVKLSKFDWMKEITSHFIEGDAALKLPARDQDMIGLISFARTPEVLAPLTLDHALLLKDLSRIQVMTDAAHNGTAIGYAILKTVNLIASTKYFAEKLVKEGKPSYEIKNTVIIIVTDGVQEVNPDDQGHPLRSIGVEEAAKRAKAEGIRVYIVNLEPAIMQPQLKYQREQLQHAAEETSGKLFIVNGTQSLPDIFRTIDELEKSRLPQKLQMRAEIEEKALQDEETMNWRRVSFYPVLIGLGILCLAIALLLETTILRRVP